jgi:NAD(P)-dependent dehydrogenase (short-subunit alcohol dehydrogenase family)
MNRNILIFGANGGIGSVTKDLFAKNGDSVTACNRKNLDLATCTYEQIKAILEDIDPDVIVHAAGSLNPDDAMTVNLMSAYYILDFYRRNLSNKPINLTFIGSSSYNKPSPKYILYSASKAALNSMVQSFAKLIEDNQSPVNKFYINLINPSKTNTKMRYNTVGFEPIETLLTPERVAQEIYELSSLSVGGIIKNI